MKAERLTERRDRCWHATISWFTPVCSLFSLVVLTGYWYRPLSRYERRLFGGTSLCGFVTVYHRQINTFYSKVTRWQIAGLTEGVLTGRRSRNGNPLCPLPFPEQQQWIRSESNMGVSGLRRPRFVVVAQTSSGKITFELAEATANKTILKQ